MHGFKKSFICGSALQMPNSLGGAGNGSAKSGPFVWRTRTVRRVADGARYKEKYIARVKKDWNSKQQKQQTQGGVLKFADLWANYGSGITHTDAKGNSIKEIDNYCAINLSEALIENGLSPGGVKCWGNCSTNKRHTLRAQELSDWLQGNLSGVIDITGKDFMDQIKGKTGIVFFQNYYEGAEGSMTGDHIDLWNKNEMGTYGVFDTWLRTTVPWLGTLRGMSALSKSTQILFWEIK